MGAASLWAWPKNDSLGNMALNWFRAWSTMGCGDKCAGASADAVHPRWIARLGGEEQHGPQQCQRRRDKRAARQISHSCTQHHGHAPRPDTLWHHNAHGQPKGQRPSELCTLAYPLGLQGTMGATWFLDMSKNCNLGRMALNWLRAWPTMVCEGKRTGASAGTAQTRWIARRGAKSNTDQRRANKGGTSAPRRISLIDARSITAMRQDQTRYGTTAIKVGNGPLNFAR